MNTGVYVRNMSPKLEREQIYCTATEEGGRPSGVRHLRWALDEGREKGYREKMPHKCPTELRGQKSTRA